MADAVLTITDVYDSVIAGNTPAFDLTALTGGAAGGSEQTGMSLAGYQGADWTWKFGGAYKYLCGQTLQGVNFQDTAGGAAFTGNPGSYLSVSCSLQDYGDSNGQPLGGPLTNQTACDIMNWPSSPDPGSSNSGRKWPGLECDQNLREFHFRGKAAGGVYVIEAVMANGDVATATVALSGGSPAHVAVGAGGDAGKLVYTDNSSFGAGKDIWFRVQYRSITPTTIEPRIRRKTANDSHGQSMWQMATWRPPIIAAPRPSMHRNLMLWRSLQQGI